MKNILKGLILALTMIGLVVPFVSVQAQVALQITSPLVLPSGSTNSPYSYKFTASGGTKPYKWEVLPQQLNVYHCCLIGLSQNGTFASVGPDKNEHMPYSGTFQIGVKVTDARGQSVQQISTYTISGNNHDDTGTEKYKAGQIETISATKVSGWAYDNDRAVEIIAEIENIASGRRTSYGFNSALNVLRPEIASYLSTKFAIGGIIVPLGFSFDPSTKITESGKYKIKSINYNGNKFSFTVDKDTVFIIGSGDPTTTDTSIYGKEKVVKVKGSNKLYYINTRGQYLPLLNKEVFASYGNKTENIESITKKVLKKYTLVKYIKLSSSDTIYEIKGKIKRPLSAEAKTRLITDSSKVLEVNQVELDSYKTGKTID